jgi:hypothetical protein
MNVGGDSPSHRCFGSQHDKEGGRRVSSDKVVVAVTQGRSGTMGGGGFLTGDDDVVAETGEDID